MAQIEILSEREAPAGWLFTIEVLGEEGSLSRFDVNLSWVDYNLWSASGADAPSQVAAAVIRFLLLRSENRDLKPSFDASIARRMYPEADTQIPTLIHDFP